VVSADRVNDPGIPVFAAAPTIETWGASRRQTLFFVSDPPCRALGFWIIHGFRATIGLLAGGPLKDFGEGVEQFRRGCQSRSDAPRQIRDTVGSEKAEPLD
jgi:hypothetical protein